MIGSVFQRRVTDAMSGELASGLDDILHIGVTAADVCAVVALPPIRRGVSVRETAVEVVPDRADGARTA
ncbi:hypothetical protein [Streptomyces sp. NPDC101234]|uniref:hypothetical protein n=1 Tax=Streptomyces sp. NPDC101234 TaxID=3366138 RepID=UPI00381E0306